jgi:myosin protein heavy chain/myosin heavy chain 6/7
MQPMGVLSLLEEECMVPKGSDEGFASKLMQNHMGKSTKFGRPKPTKKSAAVEHFSIEHYAGTVNSHELIKNEMNELQVCYNVDNWVEKNKEPLNDSIMEQLQTSTLKLLTALFADTVTAASAASASASK